MFESTTTIDPNGTFRIPLALILDGHLRTLSDPALRLLLAYAYHFGESEECCPSPGRLAEITDLSSARLAAAKAELIQTGWITAQPRGPLWIAGTTCPETEVE